MVMKKIVLTLLAFILIHASFAQNSVESDITALVNINPELSITPQSISSVVPPLSILEKNISITNNGNNNISITITAIGEISPWFTSLSFNILPSEIRTVNLFFNINETEAGAYSGNISINDFKIPVGLTVTENYKLTVNIDAADIQPGENISVLTELKKTKRRRRDPEVEGQIPVTLVFNILKGRTLVTSLSTTMNVTDAAVKTIQIPFDASSGRYKIEVSAVHLSKIAKDRDSFRVGSSAIASLFTQILDFFRR